MMVLLVCRLIDTGMRYAYWGSEGSVSRRLYTTLKYPVYSIFEVSVKLLRNTSAGPDIVGAVGHPGITRIRVGACYPNESLNQNIQLKGGDSSHFAQNTFVQKSLITSRINSTNLDEEWWKVRMVWMQ